MAARTVTQVMRSNGHIQVPCEIEWQAAPVRERTEAAFDHPAPLQHREGLLTGRE
ncbi:hypothetical protein GCM10011504_54660 [Siccirubricoccus deserti]|nr:hypothetical protein GCM10011504_54660 [Siccirubricoccus deserti]